MGFFFPSRDCFPASGRENAGLSPNPPEKVKVSKKTIVRDKLLTDGLLAVLGGAGWTLEPAK